MIDVDKIKVGDKVKLITDNWDDCQVFSVKGNVYTVVPRDNLAEEFFTKDTVEVDIFSYFDHHCEDFELVEEESETTESIPWKIQVLTRDHEYQGLYKGSIHVVKTFSSNGTVQFYHNGKLWTLDPEDYEDYVEQPLSEQDIREIKEVVDLFIPDSNKDSALDKQEGGGHYKGLKIQPIEYIHANGLTYLEGNVIKYTTRHKSKNKEQDIKKAIHYLELILELEYGG